MCRHVYGEKREKKSMRAREEPMRSVRPLFGGAISMPTEHTSGWLDASDVRQVPDHQEVWTEPCGHADRSLVVELLEALPGTDEEAAREHFVELCDGCIAGQLVLMAPVLPVEQAEAGASGTVALAPAVAMSGMQQLADGTRALASVVLVRLHAQATDILVAVYRPLPAAPSPAEAEAAAADAALAASVRTTLAVQDWGLFGGEAKRG